MPNPSTTLYPSATLYPEGPPEATPSPARWSFFAVDRAGNLLGEVQGAMARTVTPRPLKALGSASFRLRVDHPLVPYFADDTTRLKVYEDTPGGVRRLRFVGPMTSFEETHGSDGQDGVTVGFTSGGYFLGDRFVGKTRTGFSLGTAASPVDRGSIMTTALGQANGDGPTGVVSGSVTAGDSSTFTYVQAAIFKPVLELFDDMGGPLGGPDWEFEPIEPLANGGNIAKLNIAPAIGAIKPDAVFEYGRGRDNVKTWRRVIDPKTVANKAYHLPVGFPDNTSGAVISASDTTSIGDRGLHEALVAADLSEDATRTALVQEHVAVRKFPRQVIVFEPRMETINDLRYRVDYAEGDIVPFSAVQRYPDVDSTGTYGTGNTEVVLIDALFRIRAVTFNLSENGDATPVFTMTAEDT